MSPWDHGFYVIIAFGLVAGFMGAALFASTRWSPRARYKQGRNWAFDLYDKDPVKARDLISKNLAAIRALRELGDFDQGVSDVYAEMESERLETYEEVKQRGVKFASQILRNYPETGLLTLEESFARHCEGSGDFDQAFADGIQEVLDQLAGMIKNDQ